MGDDSAAEEFEHSRELVAGVREPVPAAELASFFGRAIAEVGVRIPHELIVGPVVAVYHRDTGDSFDVTVGFPVARDPGVSGFELVELPAGRAVRIIHHGDYGALHDVYLALEAALHDRGAVRSISWERYPIGPEDNPDPAAWVTEVVAPVVTA
ncbi:GyrI-like domain-containing protein [Pseudolysinimonas sp.]|uniref:GyrI-like domain-containing protein n=1 Tax=Pseudolysinimonas sp. TaxID=2680009 RepID=UPI003F7DCC75